MPVPLSGRVFEDVNYGGGAGRDQVTASGVPCSGARVELYDGAGSFVSSTTTDASGEYSFRGIAAGTYTVRVVNSTVTSSRAGYVAGLLPVQTYPDRRLDGTAVPVTNYVGGQDPAVADAGSGSAGTAMDTTTGVFTAGLAGTAQSIADAARRSGWRLGRRLRLQLRHDRQRERLRPGIAAAVHPQQQRPGQRGRSPSWVSRRAGTCRYS